MCKLLLIVTNKQKTKKRKKEKEMLTALSSWTTMDYTGRQNMAEWKDRVQQIEFSLFFGAEFDILWGFNLFDS